MSERACMAHSLVGMRVCARVSGALVVCLVVAAVTPAIAVVGTCSFVSLTVKRSLRKRFVRLYADCSEPSVSKTNKRPSRLEAGRPIGVRARRFSER